MSPHPDNISGLARRLAREAEAVCRHYLSNGRREGRYWVVGDVENNPGRSLYVRLHGPDYGKGAAGKWTDAATGVHGDLLDLIGAHSRLGDVREVADEARTFLSLPRRDPGSSNRNARHGMPNDADRAHAARRLWSLSRPLPGTVAEGYLRTRHLTMLDGTEALRFHPACYHRGGDGASQQLPALIASVTDSRGLVCGVHRTWLQPDGSGKADLANPRRAMGNLLGHGVRFGFDQYSADMAVGEGIETMLSLRVILPAMPMIAALSAGHLGAVLFPDGLRRIYIAADGDGAGRHGLQRLSLRARQAGIEALTLRPMLGDFNDDLRRQGREALALHLRPQLIDEDWPRL